MISYFERKRRPDICVTENHSKNFTPVTIPGNSNHASISKNGRKNLVVGDSHVKQIRRIDFNKEHRHGKANFRPFSGATSKQLDQYIIPSFVDDKPDAVFIQVGTKTFYAMPAMKTSLGISSRLTRIVKVTVLTMFLFCQS